MNWLRRWRRQRLLRRHAFGDAAWERATHDLHALRHLTPSQHTRLREAATLIAAEKDFLQPGGAPLPQAQVARVAALAALPVLELGLDWYRGWHSVIVYPTGFVARHTVEDEAGVVHEVREDLSGEAWDAGPVILAWEDVLDAGAADGYNVVLHEFAHKLDMANGEANGMPPLHRGMSRAAWTAAFTAAWEDLQRRADAGLPLVVDAYALEAPEECFAVMTEAFFERAQALAEAYPAVYRQLVAFYRQDPGGRR